MKKETKKVWQEMEKLGWSNEPKDFHLEYFENIIEATKQAFSLTDVVKSLKDIKTIPFEDWLKNFKKTEDDLYWFDKETLYCIEAMKEIYNDLPY